MLHICNTGWLLSRLWSHRQLDIVAKAIASFLDNCRMLGRHLYVTYQVTIWGELCVVKIVKWEVLATCSSVENENNYMVRSHVIDRKLSIARYAAYLDADYMGLERMCACPRWPPCLDLCLRLFRNLLYDTILNNMILNVFR